MTTLEWQQTFADVAAHFRDAGWGGCFVLLGEALRVPGRVGASLRWNMLAGRLPHHNDNARLACLTQ
jgi:hypothetical protein